MREAHKNDYTAATQYIMALMAQINSSSINAPGSNARRVSETKSNNNDVSDADLNRTEWNGVDIRDPWRKFSDDEWYKKLKEWGLENSPCQAPP
jgi:hypothetical protein